LLGHISFYIASLHLHLHRNITRMTYINTRQIIVVRAGVRQTMIITGCCLQFILETAI